MAKKDDKPRQRNIARLKDLKHRYEVMESHEAGIELMGTEVKSLREGKISLKNGYCTFRNNELYLMNVHISPYSHGTHVNHDPERPRKLLMHKRELEKLRSKAAEKGLTIVPARMYFNEKNRAKAEIALVKGKKLYDRREEIKKRDQKREMERAIKKYK